MRNPSLWQRPEGGFPRLPSSPSLPQEGSPATCLTFLVRQHLHPAAEHGLQHGVVPCQHLHSGIVQGPAHVESHILVTKAIAYPEAAALGLGSWGGAEGSQASVARHLLLQVDDDAAEGGLGRFRRGGGEE